MPLMMSLNSSMRRLSSLWKGFVDTGSSPIGGSEQSAMAAEVSAFRRSTIARRFSRNHSAEESRGSRFEMRKNVLALVETNARTSFPPMKTTIFFGWDATTSESRWRALYARSPPTPKLRNVTRLSPSLRCSSMIQLNACPFPAVLLEPRHATIKDGSRTVGGGSVWCGGFCGLVMCFQDREDERIFAIKTKASLLISGWGAFGRNHCARLGLITASPLCVQVGFGFSYTPLEFS